MEQEVHKNYVFASEVPFNEKKKDYLGKFLDYCFKVLALTEEKPVEIWFPTERSQDPEMITTAYYNDGDSKISIYAENRAFIDIARSLAHELVHKKQFSLDPELKTAGHEEKVWEDQANAVAGKIIRGFGKKYPEAYDEGELEESIKTLQELTGKIVVLDNIDEDACPVCEKKMKMQCKCGGSGSHTLESLKNGHGKMCENFHRWSYKTPDGKVIIYKDEPKKR